MNGLPGMNDKTEGLFAWDIIYKSDSTDNQNERRRNDEINNAFIVSFSDEDSCDDLTLWRLYGDDAKGVWCEYEIIEEKLRDRFYLGKVNYIDKKSNNDTISDPLLKQFKEIVDNSDLPYIDFSPIIFFYKNKAFEVENEVRLLVDNKNDKNYNNPQYDRNWVLTNSNNIPNPYIDIPLNEIPLKLVKIFLGPNINDADTISSQLETMLEQIGINAEVQLSNIETYRNPSK